MGSHLRPSILLLLLAPVAASTASADHLPPPFAVEQVDLDIRWGGRMTTVAVSPASDLVWLATAESGGLYRTDDGGATWSRVDTLPTHRLHDVAWAPNAAGTILVTAAPDYRTPTNSSGVWRSTNFGATWYLVDAMIPSCHPGSAIETARGIAFNPTNTDVYVATDCGVAISRDGGATWTHVAPDPAATTENQEHTVLVQPGGLITACGEDGIHRSTDAGLTWSTGWDPREPMRAFGDVCDESGYHALAGSPVESDVFYVALRDLSDGAGSVPTGALYEVRYDTATNAPLSSTRLDGSDANTRAPSVAARPAPLGGPTQYIVYFSNGLHAFARNCDSAAGRCGTDPGDWIELTIDHADPSGFAFGSGSNCPLAMSNDGGVLVSTDCGNTFVTPGPTYDGLDAIQLYDVEVQSFDDGMGGHDHTDIYVGTMDNWVWASSDGGATWPYTTGSGEGVHIEVPKVPPAHDEQIVSMSFCTPCNGVIAEEHLENPVSWTPPTEGVAARGFPHQMVLEHDSFVSVMDLRQCSGTTVDCKADDDCMVCDGTSTSCADDGGCMPGVACSLPTGVTCASVGDIRMYLQEGLGMPWVERLPLSRTPGNARLQLSGPASNPSIFFPVNVGTAVFGLDRADNVRSGTPDLTLADDNLVLGGHFQGEGCFDCPKPAFAVDPSDATRLIGVGTAGDVWRSTTGGVSPDGFTPGWSMDPVATAALTAGYAKVKVRANTSDGVRTEPNIRVIEHDPYDPQQMFAGLEQGGVFYSDDGGAGWEHVPGSDPIVAVTAFAFDQITGDVYVSSYGRGLWRLRPVDLMLPPPDAYEPNDVGPLSTPLDLTHLHHWSGEVARDHGSLEPEYEQWAGGLSSLTLHDRDDVDRFDVILEHVVYHVPDLPDGPSPDDPMPICGDVLREATWRPFYAGAEKDVVMFRSWVEVEAFGLGTDEVVKTEYMASTGTSTRRFIACPPTDRVNGFSAIVGDRTGLGQRESFPTYSLRVEHGVDITRFSAANEWLRRKLQPARDSEMIFPIPCAGGSFPECPSNDPQVQLELTHPLLPDCKADGPGCRWFAPFTWQRDALFELTFASSIDLAIELWDERGQRIAEAEAVPQEDLTITKIISADITPGVYVLVVTGPPATVTVTFDTLPPAPDTDGDGFPDAIDACPNEAEDFDGDRDGDGCPEEPGDVDGDGIPDVADTCRDVRDPQQFDADNDGRGDLCDCDAGDPNVWSPPSEIPDVRFSSPFGLEWSPVDGGPGTVYEVLRSSLDDVPVTADGSDVCLAANFGGTFWQAGETPQSGGFHYLVRGRNACGIGPLGGARGSSADCSVQSCGHSTCVTGFNLFAGCDTCVATICAIDPYCCNTEWDGICVDRVRGDCGLATCPDAGSTCAHDVCATGAPLTAGCDAGGLACVAAVCDLDPYCCQTAWDDDCRVTMEAACDLGCE